MDTELCMEALAALGQETRFQTFRLLVESGQEGLPAAALAKSIKINTNSLAGHLAVLRKCRLVRRRRESRSVLYYADLDTIRRLILAMVWDTCRGDLKLRSTLVAGLE